MKHVLILVICMLLSVGVLCASTTPIPANPMAPSVIAAEGASSILLIPVGGQQLKLQAGDGGPQPLCPPSNPHCPLSGDGPVMCLPTHSCGINQLKLQAGDGGPAPLCAPGHHCDIIQLKLQAGDGGPAPLCAPGHHCDIDQLKLQAGDGGPAPLCAPGHHCDIVQERLLMAL